MNKRYLLFIILTLSVSFELCPLKQDEQEKNEKSFDEVIFEGLRTFAQVLQIAKEKHYKISDTQTCIHEAIKSFVNCLDPHSDFFDQKKYQKMMDSINGEFFGIGVIIDGTRMQKDKTLPILNTVEDGPADKAGIKPFDKIIEIDGESLEGKSTDEAMAKIKGERNTKVKIKIMREGYQDPLNFEITRDVVKEQNSLCFALQDHGIYYISLAIFSEKAIKQIEDLLKKSKEKKYKALIIDLRNNSGGLLTSVVDIAGLFLEKDSLVVTTKNKDNQATKQYVTARQPIHADIPIFILINEYTASAAEILAGCLKLHSEAITNDPKKQSKNLMVFLVGTNTFGKGSVQDVIPVGNNCALKITESLYFLLGDLSIQAEGIKPDFEIEKMLPPTEQMIWFKKNYGSEKALPNHIPNGNVKEEDKKEKDNSQSEKDEKKETVSWIDRAKKMLEADNQLRETITLINIFHLGNQCFPKKMMTRKGAIDFMNSVSATNKPLGLVEIK